eukprot:530083-Prymnesium_polylepis.2
MFDRRAWCLLRQRGCAGGAAQAARHPHRPTGRSRDVTADGDAPPHQCRDPSALRPGRRGSAAAGARAWDATHKSERACACDRHV